MNFYSCFDETGKVIARCQTKQDIEVLKKMGRERDKNIYIISHKDELQGRVNNVLKVVKENGFTSYANDVEVVEQ